TGIRPWRLKFLSPERQGKLDYRNRCPVTDLSLQRFGSLLLVALLALQAVAVQAQLNESCTISILNRTARVRPDGSWRIDNVPATFGRVRATCVEDGVTRTGQSDFFTIRQNTIAGFNADISLATVDPIPASLAITA